MAGIFSHVFSFHNNLRNICSYHLDVFTCFKLFGRVCSLMSLFLSQHLYPGLYYEQARTVCC